MTHDIGLICFDLGGVLIRICRSWQEAVQRAGVSMVGQNDTAHRLASAASSYGEGDWNQLHQYYETGRCDETQFFDRVAKQTGLTIDQARAVLTAWLFEPYPGVVELVKSLANSPHHPPTACLSNTNTFHWSMMTTEGTTRLPLECLAYRYTSFEIGASKPDTAIYEHVERASGVEPDRILFFDDHPPNVESAINRGWKVHQIDHRGDTAQQMQSVLSQYGLITP